MALPASYELHAFPYIDELAALNTEVKNTVKAADWQTFIVAMTVLVGGGFMLTSSGVTGDVKLAAAGFIGAVVSYFFGNRISTSTAAATIAASAQGSNLSNVASAQGASQQASNGGNP